MIFINIHTQERRHFFRRGHKKFKTVKKEKDLKKKKKRKDIHSFFLTVNIFFFFCPENENKKMRPTYIFS